MQTFIGGALAGLACGVLPLVIGRIKGKTILAVLALFLCVASGLVLGIILALPVAIAFSVVFITGEDPVMSRILNESARGNTDLLHQIIESKCDLPEERYQEETPFYPLVEEPTEQSSDKIPELRRPLVENLFS